jgi:hypothetical protein
VARLGPGDADFHMPRCQAKGLFVNFPCFDGRIILVPEGNCYTLLPSQAIDLCKTSPLRSLNATQQK